MKVRVASVHFCAVHAHRSAYQGQYSLPAVEQGAEPAIIEVPDMVQRYQAVFAVGQSSERRMQRDLILGEHIAADIINEWSLNGLGTSPSCRPGIWMVRDHLPELAEDGSIAIDAMGAALWRPASVEEKRAMWAEDVTANREADRRFAEYEIQQADMMIMQDERKRPLIAERARRACVMYSIERDWMRNTVAANMVACLYCGKRVIHTAIKCPYCQEVVDVAKYAELQAIQAHAVKMAKKELDQIPPQVIKGAMGLQPATT